MVFTPASSVTHLQRSSRSKSESCLVFIKGTDTTDPFHDGSFIYFYAYTALRGRLLDVHLKRVQRVQSIPAQSSPHPYPPKRPGPVALSTGEELTAGFISGVISRLVSTPLSVITVRMQAGGGRRKKTGIVSALKGIYREEGLIGLWKGTPWLLRLLLRLYEDEGHY